MSFFISRIVSTPFFTKITRNFATKMQASSTSKTKDSAGRRLGVKKFGGEEVFPNDIIIRQRGFKWKPGKNTASGLDHTIHSRVEGKVKFDIQYKKKRKITTVHVEPEKNPNRTARPPLPYTYHPEIFPERASFNPEPFKLIIRPRENIKKEKETYWFGKKDEKSLYSLNVQIPETYFSLPKPKSPPRLEFPIHEFKSS